MSTRLWYATVYVRDFDRAVAFYQNMLGLPLHGNEIFLDELRDE